jgi:hypothetical protein
MSKCFIEGVSGGASLNFNVVGSTEQPASPKENTVWVKTDSKITSWVCSPVQPAEPAEGMVWLKTGYSSNVHFNALKKNSIDVYLLSVTLWDGSAWKHYEASLHKNGAWEDVRYWIIKDGQIIESTVGSFSTKVNTEFKTMGTIKYNSDHIELTAAAMRSIGLYSVDPIKSSLYQTLVADISSSNGNGNYGRHYIELGSVWASAKFERTEKRFDISNVKSDESVIFWAMQGNSSVNAVTKIYNAWLE